MLCYLAKRSLTKKRGEREERRGEKRGEERERAMCKDEFCN